MDSFYTKCVPNLEEHQEISKCQKNMGESHLTKKLHHLFVQNLFNNVLQEYSMANHFALVLTLLSIFLCQIIRMSADF